ncbi:related to actin cytoskeleton protein (VIP1) [Ramularia collo-cygni]|uniref:Related to actin cytoskeleton protein (VIP1) n=1 Tax=Ramularia collo-cygni TaxID=112498 RepID=A0A2D3UTE8_9PEZI|nr:related to actin cytoskeleton protein (VIP1) [Ramularia collo-cygni]CZT16080.1 related to actin cytoskeleton protein (VIP1) [Ramularia collo-cygni]
MSTTIQVKNISAQSSETEIKDFFSFCGKIQSLSVKPETGDAGSAQSATVTFEKETAAKTALLLDNTQLGPSVVHVTSAQSLDQLASGKTASSADEKEKDGDDIAQEDKPRARVAAEMLAHGYVISDQAIQRALALDQQHGVSTKFQNALTNFDAKYKVTERAQAVDQQYAITAKGNQAWAGFNSYFEKAANTPTGQKIRAFYEQGQKQVLDVHNEAKHLASIKQGKAENHPVEGNPSRTECKCSANSGKCSCVPGACACSDCGKNPDAPATTKKTAEEAQMEKVTVGGQEKTKCNCGGSETACPCEAGKCACASCPKAS